MFQLSDAISIIGREDCLSMFLVESQVVVLRSS